MPSLSADVLINVVYGTAATVIGIVTIYQSYVTWKMWREHHHDHNHQTHDVELALTPAPSVPDSSNISSIDVVPVLARHESRTVANQCIAPTSFQQPGPSNLSQAEVVPAQNMNECQTAVSSEIALEPSFPQPLGRPPIATTHVIPVPITDKSKGLANKDQVLTCSPTSEPSIIHSMLEPTPPSPPLITDASVPGEVGVASGSVIAEHASVAEEVVRGFGPPTADLAKQL